MKQAFAFIIGLIIGGAAVFFYFKNQPDSNANILKPSNFMSILSAPITQAQAKGYLQNYIDECVKNGEATADILRSFFLEKKAVDSIFANKECQALRLYMGKKTPGSPLGGDYTIMVVGVDGNNENLSSNIWDECKPCPQTCPKVDF